jgi:hypothetical protein
MVRLLASRRLRIRGGCCNEHRVIAVAVQIRNSQVRFHLAFQVCKMHDTVLSKGLVLVPLQVCTALC